jgi:cell division protein FtsL
MKKNNTKAERFATIENLGILFFICVVSLFYVWEHLSIVQLGYQIKKLENQRTQAIDECSRLELQVSKLESPSNIQNLLANANLNLVIAKKMNVVCLKKPLEEQPGVGEYHWRNFHPPLEISLKPSMTAVSLAALEKEKTDKPLS